MWVLMGFAAFLKEMSETAAKEKQKVVSSSNSTQQVPIGQSNKGCSVQPPCVAPQPLER